MALDELNSLFIKYVEIWVSQQDKINISVGEFMKATGAHIEQLEKRIEKLENREALNELQIHNRLP